MAKEREGTNRREPKLIELCNTVFYLSRYAEYMELAKTITVPDERELFYEIFNWALDFERRFDQSRDHQSEIESQGHRWLLESFPYQPEQSEEIHLSMGGI